MTFDYNIKIQTTTMSTYGYIHIIFSVKNVRFARRVSVGVKALRLLNNILLVDVLRFQLNNTTLILSIYSVVLIVIHVRIPIRFLAKIALP